MSRQPQPTWQPITQLPLIASVIDGMLVEEQYRLLQQARSKPHVLDDATIGRVIAVSTTQRDDLWLFAEQLRRWAAQKQSHRRRVGNPCGYSRESPRLPALAASCLRRPPQPASAIDSQGRSAGEPHRHIRSPGRS